MTGWTRINPTNSGLLSDPVFTQGQAGKAEHLLFAGDIPVVQSDRGGKLPTTVPSGILYPLIDINGHTSAFRT